MREFLLNTLFWVGVPLLILSAMIMWVGLGYILFDELTSSDDEVGPDDVEYY